MSNILFVGMSLSGKRVSLILRPENSLCTQTGEKQKITPVVCIPEPLPHPVQCYHLHTL
jgi:hypothetical protein